MLGETRIQEHTIPVTDHLSLRLYSDTSPHSLKIANLQKGMILVSRGEELVGEGTGFGVPVVRYRDKTYFPGSARIEVSHRIDCAAVTKQFVLDLTPEKWFRKANVENKMQHRFSTLVAELYQKHRHVRQTFETLRLKNLSKSLGVHTSFARSKPVGSVTLEYQVESSFIHVKADFQRLRSHGLQKIFLLNEQGSRHFKKYLDSNGTILCDEKIGSWENVEAYWARLSDNRGKIGFRLWQAEGAILRRGRELLNGTLDWAGLDYELDQNTSCFEYDIEVLGGKKRK